VNDTGEKITSSSMDHGTSAVESASVADDDSVDSGIAAGKYITQPPSRLCLYTFVIIC
jgi:hypothetical protein